MISKRYNKFFNNIEDLKKADSKYKSSIDNIDQVKRELEHIKNIGKLTSKKSNIFFDDIKLNYNQIDIELNHLRDAILTDQIFDHSEVEALNDKFEDIFNIPHSLNIIKNILDKKNIITDILYLELDKSMPSFSKFLSTELNNILNKKKSTKGINRDLINFKNILDKYTEFNQKPFDELKTKHGIDIFVLLLNKNYVTNILSKKQVNNVEDYVEQVFIEINNFNELLNNLFIKYEMHVNSSARQINEKIREILDSKTLKTENILNDIESILISNQTVYEHDQDKKEAEEERLRLEKEAAEESLRQQEEKRLIAEENAKKAAEQARLDAKEKKEFKEGVYYLLGFVAGIIGIILLLWGFWELCVYIWMNYASIVVGIVTGILAIFSAIVFFAGSKILGAIFLIGTVFIYGFLDDLVPKKDFKENKKIESVQEIDDTKEDPKNSSKINIINTCSSSGYKDNCKGIMTYKNGTYKGFFKKDKKHGQGTYFYKNGDKYSGQWINDDKHGQGAYTWKSGNKYVGQWKTNNMHGQGTKTYKNGKIQKGIWENDKFIGSKSKKSYSKDQIKAKEIIKSNQANQCPSSGYRDNCEGTKTYSNGTYNGFFKKNERHGQGTYIWKSGNKYVGLWKKDRKHGQGMFTWKNGQTLTGTFYNGDPSYATEKFGGKWKGDRYVGNYNEWKRHGQGTYYYKNGDKFSGNWKNNNKHGQGTMTYKDGKIKKGIWEKNKFLYAQGSQNP